MTEAKSWTNLPKRRAEHRKRCNDSAKHAKRVRTELEALETELTASRDRDSVRRGPCGRVIGTTLRLFTTALGQSLSPT